MLLRKIAQQGKTQNVKVWDAAGYKDAGDGEETRGRGQTRAARGARVATGTSRAEATQSNLIKSLIASQERGV